VATHTSNFGVGKREAHNASGFYARFTPPIVSNDDTVPLPLAVTEPFVCGDSRFMTTLSDGSVALVVTSPPYFAGKQYEEELSRDGIPASYVEYLTMLRDVFAECVRVLEPGGRIAVNVANLGRKPYRSLSSDVIRILQDDLGLLLRGEIVWRKAVGATGSCAWGSYRSPANPVLRDLTERIVIASKGRFDRARSMTQRLNEGLPNEITLPTDDFLSLTLDVWDMPPESAKRVGHPAPFPVELPEQLIRLYTYKQDLVVDPFLGSGSTMVAASRLGRRYAGYDLDPTYVAIAQERVAHEGSPISDVEGDDALGAGRVAEGLLARSGFTVVGTDRRIPKTGVTLDYECQDVSGRKWYFHVIGAHTAFRAGMTNIPAVWDTLGRLNAIRSQTAGTPVVLLTAKLPDRKSESHMALHAAGPSAYFDVIDMFAVADKDRLRAYCMGSGEVQAQPGWWSPDEIGLPS
jgi:DNA modification methylase